AVPHRTSGVRGGRRVALAHPQGGSSDAEPAEKPGTDGAARLPDLLLELAEGPTEQSSRRARRDPGLQPRSTLSLLWITLLRAPAIAKTLAVDRRRNRSPAHDSAGAAWCPAPSVAPPLSERWLLHDGDLLEEPKSAKQTRAGRGRPGLRRVGSRYAHHSACGAESLGDAACPARDLPRRACARRHRVRSRG